jgi:CheY-like chemotaxis protein
MNPRDSSRADPSSPMVVTRFEMTAPRAVVAGIMQRLWYIPARVASVLVVEDDPDLREMMGEWLSTLGYRARLAKHGRDALDVLRTGLRPRVILLDLMMPVMDGWEFRRRQLQDPHLAAIPVIVTTAVPRSVTRDLAAAAVVVKPCDFDRLTELIAAFH